MPAKKRNKEVPSSLPLEEGTGEISSSGFLIVTFKLGKIVLITSSEIFFGED